MIRKRNNWSISRFSPPKTPLYFNVSVYFYTRKKKRWKFIGNTTSAQGFTCISQLTRSNINRGVWRMKQGSSRKWYSAILQCNPIRLNIPHLDLYYLLDSLGLLLLYHILHQSILQEKKILLGFPFSKLILNLPIQPSEVQIRSSEDSPWSRATEAAAREASKTTDIIRTERDILYKG